MAEILFKKANDSAIIPTLEKGASCFDLYAPERIDLKPDNSYTVCSGIIVSIPTGFVGIINPRGYMASNNNIRVGARIIHPNHVREIKINLHNDGKDLYEISKGDRVAQLVVVPSFTAFKVVEELQEQGQEFGSTGR